MSARSSKLVTMPVRNVRARRMPPAERREALINATLPLVLWHGPGVTTRLPIYSVRLVRADSATTCCGLAIALPLTRGR